MMISVLILVVVAFGRDYTIELRGEAEKLIIYANEGINVEVK